MGSGAQDDQDGGVERASEHAAPPFGAGSLASELTHHYQPIVELRGGRIVGAEALIRWARPYGVVAASLFIDAARRAGVADEITTATLTAAMQRAATWPSGGAGVAPPFLAMAVGTGMPQDPTSVRRIADALEATGLPAGRLCVEVCPDALVTPGGAEGLRALADLGVRIALDGVGAVCPPLDVPACSPRIDFLKLDRRLVERVGRDASGSARVGEIAALAQRLGGQLIADGVAHDEQREALLRAGCMLAQGFHVHEPMAADALERALRHRAA